MKLGLQIVDFTWPEGPAGIPQRLVETAQAAEAAGFDALALGDHFWQSPWVGEIEGEMLEAYTTLGFLAGKTDRIALMTMVTAATFRSPALLAKIVTTLDVLSGGRARLGIGAGHYEEEARGLDVPFPDTAERFEILEETLQICLRMWSGERGDEHPFETKHFHLERPLNSPQALTRPHPPIMIAGEGEQKTLRLVAKYGDACSLRPGPTIPDKLDVLRRHCQNEGRDYAEIEKTCAFAYDVGDNGEKAGETVQQLRGLSEMGIQSVFGFIRGAERIKPIEVIGREVIPAVAEF